MALFYFKVRVLLYQPGYDQSVLEITGLMLMMRQASFPLMHPCNDLSLLIYWSSMSSFHICNYPGQTRLWWVNIITRTL